MNRSVGLTEWIKSSMRVSFAAVWVSVLLSSQSAVLATNTQRQTRAFVSQVPLLCFMELLYNLKPTRPQGGCFSMIVLMLYVDPHSCVIKVQPNSITHVPCFYLRQINSSPLLTQPIRFSGSEDARGLNGHQPFPITHSINLNQWLVHFLAIH